MLADDAEDDDSTKIGSGEVVVVAPGLLHCRVSGYVRSEHVNPIISTSNAQIHKGYTPNLFVDAYDVHGYDVDARKYFQSWALENRAQLVAIWILFRSPLVKMGLSITHAVTDGIFRGFADRDEFMAAIAEAAIEARAGAYRRNPS